MKLLYFLTFLIPVIATAGVNIKSLSYQKGNGNKGKVVISFEGNLKESPDLLVKKDMVQVAIPGATVWPKIEKKVGVQSNIDTTLMAYQFNKEMVRVRALLPFSLEGDADRINIDMKRNQLILNFPIKGTPLVTKKRNKTKTFSLTSKKSRKTKRKEKSMKDKYDESYLAELLTDQEESSPTKFGKDFEKGKNSAKESNSSDKIKTKISGLDKFSDNKKSEGFSVSKYIGKFVAFLGLILLVFFGLIKLFKKGVINKGKLSFLKNSEFVSVINTTYIGPKRSLLLVKVYDQIVLLGNSENGLTFLKEVDGLSDIIKSSEKDATGVNFDQKLSTAEIDPNIEKSMKIKEDINKSKGSLESFLTKETVKEKVKFSDKIKNRAKNLKPMQ